MNIGSKHLKTLLLLISPLFQACVETFEPVTELFESALIIEATITNEEKQHEILLSRTFRFEEDGPNPEENAEVRILDDSGNRYPFEEIAPGVYISIDSFAARSNSSYVLEVSTSNGRGYESTPTKLAPTAEITDLYAAQGTNQNNEEGITLFVDASGTDGEARYYRYEYEETYKIVAPRWVSVDAVVIDERPLPPIIELENKTEEQRVCYGTERSNGIIIADTKDFGSDRLTRFPVRFIRSDDFIISHRYSLLLKQFVQTRDAFNYYETLNEFSSRSESLFSQTQPGFFNGNVFSTDNSEEKVLGFFEVSSVSAERLFFNFEDFYPGESLPPYVTDCEEVFNPNLFPTAPGGPSPLVQAINDLKLKYVSAAESTDQPYFLVARPCGDCTALGSNVVPDFWIE